MAATSHPHPEERRESWEAKQQNSNQRPESRELGAAMGSGLQTQPHCPLHVSPGPVLFIFHSTG